MSDKIIEDNKELIRIIGNFSYPAEIQYKFLQKQGKKLKLWTEGGSLTP